MGFRFFGEADVSAGRTLDSKWFLPAPRGARLVFLRARSRKGRGYFAYWGARTQCALLCLDVVRVEMIGLEACAERDLQRGIKSCGGRNNGNKGDCRTICSHLLGTTKVGEVDTIVYTHTR